MRLLADYHMHTPLCGHASGEPAEYAAHAVRIGLQEIGFSDHSPLLTNPDPSITMSREQLPEYHAMIEDVQAKFKGRLTVKIALEADYLPGYEKQTRDILDSYPYDYAIGSVHFIKEWCFDNPADIQSWSGKDVDKVYRTYYDLLRKSAQSGMFDIMGHVDLVKKFGHRPVEDMAEEIRKTAKVFKESGVAVEINTAGLRKPVKEMYPALNALTIYRQAGVPLTFGSDAHSPKDVGADFGKAVELALAAGYKEYLLFKKRKIERTVKL
ncbi:MAG: histidinol-phosphatase HisJ [Candidatus Omnitrophota bacterium]|nr:histidinol-phosphatase HisJ [Candidatus Omnitrophota bacterium]MDZ4241531.1 histidinol-phosphatase HisJ [Candidatus Omnitrophota bacterium]